MWHKPGVVQSYSGPGGKWSRMGERNFWWCACPQAGWWVPRCATQTEGSTQSIRYLPSWVHLWVCTHSNQNIQSWVKEKSYFKLPFELQLAWSHMLFRLLICFCFCFFKLKSQFFPSHKMGITPSAQGQKDLWLITPISLGNVFFINARDTLSDVSWPSSVTSGLAQCLRSLLCAGLCSYGAFCPQFSCNRKTRNVDLGHYNLKFQA